MRARQWLVTVTEDRWQTWRGRGREEEIGSVE
jgi:hypothetical protein